jgi:hypothetical protein
MKFRAGDCVHHAPTGEDWTLATDEEGGYVNWCGWPDGIARADECTLKQRASDVDRANMLRDVANMREDNGSVSRRALIAQRQLSQSDGSAT